MAFARTAVLADRQQRVGDDKLPQPPHRHPMSEEPIWDEKAVRDAMVARTQQGKSDEK
ncbi:hypothetical protein C4K14_4156 [Pseudomonas chlororaphis subsp. aureofaciens]|nr:hypothetical protein C4K14_4156 [Pseudomonas chlororaphis subsp. aureofaciens]